MTPRCAALSLLFFWRLIGLRLTGYVATTSVGVRLTSPDRLHMQQSEDNII